MSRKWMKTFALLVVAMLAPAMAFAGSPWTEKATYNEKAVGKLEFGMKNLLGGWTEILTEPVAAIDAKEGVAKIAVAVGRGFVNAAIYMTGGALHLATFPITSLDVPIPNNGVEF